MEQSAKYIIILFKILINKELFPAIRYNLFFSEKDFKKGFPLLSGLGFGVNNSIRL